MEGRPLERDEVHLATLALPMSLTLAADLMAAIGKVAKRHGLLEPSILTDGTNRLVARRAA
jgi:hypothetical protein